MLQGLGGNVGGGILDLVNDLGNPLADEGAQVGLDGDGCRLLGIGRDGEEAFSRAATCWQIDVGRETLQ